MEIVVKNCTKEHQKQNQCRFTTRGPRNCTITFTYHASTTNESGYINSQLAGNGTAYSTDKIFSRHTSLIEPAQVEHSTTRA